MVSARLEPHPSQKAFFASEDRFVIAVCGVQSGKSLAAAHRFVRRIVEDTRASQSPLNYWVVAPTYQLLFQGQAYLRQFTSKLNLVWSGLSGGIFTTAKNSRIRLSFRSAENPDRLVAEPVHGLWIDEVARMKESAWSGALLGRLIATKGWMQATTSPMGENWVIKQMFLPGRRPGEKWHDPLLEDPGWRSFFWYSEENPAIDKAFLEERRRSMPPAMYDREFRADFTAFHGKVYDQLSKDRHVKPCDVNAYPQTVGGMDFGFGPGHPGVLLICGIDPVRRRVGVLEEHVHEGKTPDQWLDILCGAALRYPQLRYVHADSARPDLMAQMRARQPGVLAGRRRSVDIVPADKEVLAGIMAVAELVYTDSLVIDPKCRETIRQMMSYRWAEKKTGMADVPVKADDDACVARGTLVQMADGTSKPVERVRVGEMVATRIGACRVLAASQTGSMVPVQRVVLAGGRSLTATPNHRVCTQGDGWQRIDAVQHAAPCLLSTGIAGWSAVESIEHAGTSDVFDLTVEGAHEYIANGIVVHNCDAIRYLVMGCGLQRTNSRAA